LAGTINNVSMSRAIDNVIRQSKELSKVHREALLQLFVWRSFYEFALHTLDTRNSWGYRLQRGLLVAVMALSLASFLSVAVVLDSPIEWYHLLLTMLVVAASGGLVFVDSVLLQHGGVPVAQLLCTEGEVKAELDAMWEEVDTEDALEAVSFKSALGKKRRLLQRSRLRHSGLRVDFARHLSSHLSQASLKIVSDVLLVEERPVEPSRKPSGKHARASKEVRASRAKQSGGREAAPYVHSDSENSENSENSGAVSCSSSSGGWSDASDGPPCSPEQKQSKKRGKAHSKARDASPTGAL